MSFYILCYMLLNILYNLNLTFMKIRPFIQPIGNICYAEK